MTLLELLALLRKHLQLVIIVPLACAFVTAAYCWGVMPNEYTADVSIYALTKNTSQTTSEDSVSYSDLQSSQLLANDFAELAKNEQVRANTAASLGMDSLSGYDISVTSSTTTRILKVEVTGQDPEYAALISDLLKTQPGYRSILFDVEIFGKCKCPCAWLLPCFFKTFPKVAEFLYRSK